MSPALKDLALYFLKLGTIGFGGPAALVGYMRRDLVEQRKVLDEETYNLALALAQIMPGPLAAQTAFAIGFFLHGVLGATVVALAFVLPSFFMVVALAWLYVQYGGLPWMQALFYGIGAVVIAIIAVAAYRLARGTNKRDPLLWAVFLALLVATVWAQAELAELFLAAGIVVVAVRAPPRFIAQRARVGMLVPAGLLASVSPAIGSWTGNVLVDIFLFFVKAGLFVFGSGLAIVPFLREGVVADFGWLNEHQFLDAVAVALITPGPVVITVGFIGYLVAGFAGATVAALGMFLPTYLLTVVPAPWFARYRNNGQLRAFVAGATAAASGAIAGAVIVLAQRAIVDVPTAIIGALGLVFLVRFRVPEPILVAAAGIAGLAVSPM
jgi:chromate transporter